MNYSNDNNNINEQYKIRFLNERAIYIVYNDKNKWWRNNDKHYKYFSLWLIHEQTRPYIYDAKYNIAYALHTINNENEKEKYIWENILYKDEKEKNIQYTIIKYLKLMKNI